MDFTTGAFDAFTMSSVGIALCEHYGMSKGRSLTAYIGEAEEKDTTRLIIDLLEYYEAYFQNEIEFDEATFHGAYSKQEAQKYNNLYKKCRQIIDRVNSTSSSLEHKSEELKKRFSSDYISSQIDLMVRMQAENPTEAIGKAKELIESCCKTILEEQGCVIDKNWTVSQLVRATMKQLDVAADSIDSSTKEGSTIKAILGSLQGIAGGVAELRNAYGSGHGKSASYKGLSSRHAKLAVGSSTTLVEYLWDTYEWKRVQAGNSTQPRA